MLIYGQKLKKLSRFSKEPKQFEIQCDNLLNDGHISLTALFSDWLRLDLFDEQRSSAFESIMCEVLTEYRISPIYNDGVFHFLPDVIFKHVAYTSEVGPIIFYIKDMLTDELRYLDFQSCLLKNTLRKAQSYVLTLEPNFIDNGALNTQMVGIDRIIDVKTADLNQFMSKIEGYTFCPPPRIEVMNFNGKFTEI